MTYNPGINSPISTCMHAVGVVTTGLLAGRSLLYAVFASKTRRSESTIPDPSTNGPSWPLLPTNYVHRTCCCFLLPRGCVGACVRVCVCACVRARPHVYVCVCVRVCAYISISVQCTDGLRGKSQPASQPIIQPAQLSKQAKSLSPVSPPSPALWRRDVVVDVWLPNERETNGAAFNASPPLPLHGVRSHLPPSNQGRAL